MSAVPVRSAVRAAAEKLAAAGIESPLHDAQELAAHVLGVGRKDLVRHECIDAPAYEALVARRAAREPLQHITGRAHFRRISLEVGPGVFVPRPETEVMTGVAIELAATLQAPVVVDLFAGAGPVALSVAAEVPQATVHAVEREDAAFAWLQRNAATSRVIIHHADAADCLPELDGAVDVVVANPPYVPIDATISFPEVADYDPPTALWSGTDGLDAMRVLEWVAGRLLRPGGWVLAEHSDLQGEAAPQVFSTGRWVDVHDRVDLAGRPRFVVARRRGSEAERA